MGTLEEHNSRKVLLETTDKGINVISTRNGEIKSKLNGHEPAFLDLKDAEIKLTLMKNPEDKVQLSAITSLNLSYCNLKYLPYSIVQLGQLLELNVSHNNFKEVPYCIYGYFKFLECLDLSNNFIEEFDYQPLCAIRLRVLNLNNNRIINIPLWVLKVTCLNLEELYFNNNDVTSLKKSKFHCQSPYRLKVVELRNCCVRPQDINSLRLIRTLTALDLSNNFTESHKYNCFLTPRSLTSLLDKPRWDDSLKVLKLANLSISDLPEEIKTIVNLEELHLDHNKLSWMPEGINSLAQLQVLDISYNELTYLNIKLGKLKVLKASHNDLGEMNYSTPELRYLDLYDNSIRVAADVYLSPYLQEIDLEQNYFDPAEVKISNYEALKTALRLPMWSTRFDGPKEDSVVSNCSECSSPTYSDITDDGGVEGEFSNDAADDDDWSTSRQLCEVPDNGCTLSDNEWIGSDVPILKPKKNLTPVSPLLFELYEDA